MIQKMEGQHEHLNEPKEPLDFSSSQTHLLDVVGDSERVYYISTENNERSTFVQASRKLFRILTKCTGLWNLHHTRYRVLCMLFIVLNVISVATETVLLTICGPIGERCTSMGTASTDVHDNKTTEIQNERTFIAIIESMFTWNGFASTLTLILLIHSLWKLQEKFPFMSFDAAQNRVGKKEWLFIDLILVICVVNFVVAIRQHVLLHTDSLKPFFFIFDSTILITYWTGMYCCCIFIVLCCAMTCLVSECFEDIVKAVDGNLNTIVALHQQLRDKLFSISRFLSNWFLAHWILFGANCLSFLAFYSTHYSFVLDNGSVAIDVIALVLTLTIFVVPCVAASRVTWKCKELLYKISNRKQEDWGEQHAFWDRATLNHFILYAERSECGFRVANFTFDAKGAWFSVLVGITGLVLKLVAFSKNMDIL